MSEGTDGTAPAEEDVGGTASEAPPGCGAHGAALLLASTAAVILMAALTFGCWLLYRLVA